VRAAPLRGRAGDRSAGPSDDGHWTLDGTPVTLPLAADSPWARSADGTLTRAGVEVHADLGEIARPRFYDLTTADGTPYAQLARLHGTHVLVATMRPATLPEQLAQVARAAVRLDGVRQLVVTSAPAPAGGRGRESGARRLARCVAAVRAVLADLPIQVQVDAPADLAWIGRLHRAGATAIAIHAESLDDEVRRRATPGRTVVPMARYEEAWAEAVRVFGRNRVSTYLLIGRGEDPDELVAGARRLIRMGVYPFVVPYRPLEEGLAHDDAAQAPSHEIVADVTDRVGRALRNAGMRGADQAAGCAACGACSPLSAVGG
jgi:biotin synthase-related radical SAM superfamily protein